MFHPLEVKAKINISLSCCDFFSKININLWLKLMSAWINVNTDNAILSKKMQNKPGSQLIQTGGVCCSAGNKRTSLRNFNGLKKIPCRNSCCWRCFHPLGKKLLFLSRNVDMTALNDRKTEQIQNNGTEIRTKSCFFLIEHFCCHLFVSNGAELNEGNDITLRKHIVQMTADLGIMYFLSILHISYWTKLRKC